MDFLDTITNFNYLGFLWTVFSLLTFETLLKVLVIYFFIVWIAIIVWVTKDIINRTNNILLQIFSILTVLVWTPLWIVVYLLIRPSQTLFEKYYEEVQFDENEEFSLDNKADDFTTTSIKETEKEEIVKCPNCSYPINADFKFCPNCRQELKKDCISCYKELKPEWTVCPYCGKNQEEKVENILNSWEENKKLEEEKSIKEWEVEIIKS